MMKNIGRFTLIAVVTILFMMKNIRSEESKIKGSPVFGKIEENCLIYDSINGKAINVIEKGNVVEIIKDRSESWYYVRFKNSMGWIKGKYLLIDEEAEVNEQMLTNTEIQDFAKEYFKSDTDFFVWVDIDRQRVYVLRNCGGWQPEKTIICATGKNKTPTIRGFFKISDRGEWFYSERLNSGAKYWVRFNDSYLFHSVAMNEKGEITDNVLGKKRSSGCVRMSVDDAKWFYNTIPAGTGVFVF